MKSESPCIGCRKWKLCQLRGPALAEKRCILLQKWNKRMTEYRKREGV